MRQPVGKTRKPPEPQWHIDLHDIAADYGGAWTNIDLCHGRAIISPSCKCSAMTMLSTTYSQGVTSDSGPTSVNATNGSECLIPGSFRRTRTTRTCTASTVYHRSGPAYSRSWVRFPPATNKRLCSIGCMMNHEQKPRLGGLEIWKSFILIRFVEKKCVRKLLNKIFILFVNMSCIFTRNDWYCVWEHCICWCSGTTGTATLEVISVYIPLILYWWPGTVRCQAMAWHC